MKKTKIHYIHAWNCQRIGNILNGKRTWNFYFSSEDRWMARITTSGKMLILAIVKSYFICVMMAIIKKLPAFLKLWRYWNPHTLIWQYKMHHPPCKSVYYLPNRLATWYSYSTLRHILKRRENIFLHENWWINVPSILIITNS